MGRISADLPAEANPTNARWRERSRPIDIGVGEPVGERRGGLG